MYDYNILRTHTPLSGQFEELAGWRGTCAIIKSRVPFSSPLFEEPLLVPIDGCVCVIVALSLSLNGS